ncbi:MAG: transporter [Verrucomicrobiaceae bacterium]|nr:transporter [Verrucomicrobiaceae bacterium]
MPAKQPHPLADLLLTVVLPSVALEYLSEPAKLGPFWALVVSALLPLTFGIYCWVTKAGLNFLSVLGLAAVMVSGGLGLLKLDAFWFGMKEIIVPVLIGFAFPASHAWGRPIIGSMIFAPHLINERALRASLDTMEKQAGFDRLLLKASWGMGASMLLSAVINFALAMYLLGGKEPGSEAFVKGMGTLNWGGTLIIGIPMLVAMMVVMFSFMRGVFRLTGLHKDDLMGPGRTVRRIVE